MHLSSVKTSRFYFIVQEFLSAAAASCAISSAAPLLQTRLMNDEERSVLLYEFNSTNPHHATSDLLHPKPSIMGLFDESHGASSLVQGSFAAWAKVRGGSPCVVYEGHVWSYREVGKAFTAV